MQPRVNSFGGDLIDERQVIVKLLACVCCHGCPPHIPMHLQHPLLSEHVWAQIQLKCRRWILHNVVWWWQHQLDQVRRIDNMDIVAQYWHSVHLSQPATMQRYSSNFSELSSPNTSSILPIFVDNKWMSSHDHITLRLWFLQWILEPARSASQTYVTGRCRPHLTTCFPRW